MTVIKPLILFSVADEGVSFQSPEKKIGFERLEKTLLIVVTDSRRGDSFKSKCELAT